MRFEKVDIAQDKKWDYARDNGWAYFSMENMDSDVDMFEMFNHSLKPYGLEIVMLDDDDNTFYKIKPRTLLDATKYNLEKGIEIG